MPGHIVGEKRKEQLAVTRQPRARPALPSLRSVDGCAKRIEDAMVPTVSVMRAIEVVEMMGAVDVTTEVRTVRTASRAPLSNVRSTASGVHVNGDDVPPLMLPVRLRDHGVDTERGEPPDVVVDAPARVGSGGGSTSTDIASAR